MIKGIRQGWSVLLLLLSGGAAAAQVVLPGTQPGAPGVKLETAQVCAACHAQTASGPHGPDASWQTGMMSLATKDPVFRAAMAIANQDIDGVGDFCLRCHTPRGFFAGRTQPADGTALEPDDLQGVTCVVCHRLVDPRTQEATWMAQTVPPGPGNGMMVIDPAYLMRGPYGDRLGAALRPHQVRKYPFLAEGHLCGTCHDVSNPTLANDVNTQPPHTYGHIERTYSEWLLSDFVKEGPAGTCQACHLPAVAGGGHPTRFPQHPKREYFVEHGAVGGSTWVQDAVRHIWGDKAPDRAVLARGQEKARRLLRTAATLELSFPAAGQARVRVTNQTGHKLPTGYPEGRRMWLNARFYDAAGALLHEVGRYGEQETTVLGQAVKLPTVLDPEHTRVYECLPGISAPRAAKYGKTAGPSFFFVLNDVVTKDNRIPPRGFANEAFAKRGCEPVGHSYADGQHWDDVELRLPEKTARVEVRLMYQSVSAEYVKFLVEENRTDEWGKRVYEAWNETGRCPPEVIAEVSGAVAAGAG